jgi:hypothetical protein
MTAYYLKEPYGSSSNVALYIWLFANGNAYPYDVIIGDNAHAHDVITRDRLGMTSSLEIGWADSNKA